MKLEALKQLAEALEQPLPGGFTWDWSNFNQEECGCALSLGRYLRILTPEDLRQKCYSYTDVLWNGMIMAQYFDIPQDDFDVIFMTRGDDGVKMLDKNIGPRIVARRIRRFLSEVENEH